MKKIIIPLSFILPIFIFIYFGQLSTTDTLKGYDLWHGTWDSDKTGVKGDFQVSIQKEGTAISGKLKINGSSITKGGDITGTINGDKIEFGLAKDKRGKLIYAGRIKANTMSGIWEVPIIKDRGTWRASKKID